MATKNSDKIARFTKLFLAIHPFVMAVSALGFILSIRFEKISIGAAVGLFFAVFIWNFFEISAIKKISTQGKGSLMSCGLIVNEDVDIDTCTFCILLSFLFSYILSLMPLVLYFYR